MNSCAWWLPLNRLFLSRSWCVSDTKVRQSETGTTDKSKDLWFIGATPQYAASLWIGMDKPENMYVSASDFAAPLWGWWMHSIHKDINEPTDFEGMIWTCTNMSKNRLAPQSQLSVDQSASIERTTSSGYCPHEHPKIEKKYYGLWFRPSTPVKTKKKTICTCSHNTEDQEHRRVAYDLLEQRERKKRKVSFLLFPLSKQNG